MRILVRLLGVGLIGVGLVLFFANDIKEHLIASSNSKLEECYLAGDCTNVDYSALELNAITQGMSNGDTSTQDMNSMFEQLGPDEVQRILRETPVDQDLNGIFYADKIGLVEPLYDGANAVNLTRGLGIVEGSDLESNNLSIAGHRVEGVGIRFNEIDQLVQGDTVRILINDGDGEEVEERIYEITESFKVAPTQVEVMSQITGNPNQELTLITCDDYNPNTGIWETRLIVKAEQVN